MTDPRPGLMLSDELNPSELISLARLAEDVGYDELWYTDQRFWRDCTVGLTLVARETKRIRLGPGVHDPFTRHPALIAMSAATLDELSGGRVQLGLGTGGSGIAEMKLPKQRSVRALQEAIELIRELLTGEHVDYTGELYFLAGGRLGFTPVRRSIPIVIATHSPQTLRLSGRLADGVLLGNMGQPRAIDRAVEAVRGGEAVAGRPPGTVRINLRLEAIIGADRSVAINQMKRRLAARLISSYPRWDHLADLGIVTSPALEAAAAAKDIERMSKSVSDADVRATALVGDPDEAAEQLAALLAPAIDRVTIRPYAVAGHGQDVTIRHFAEDVWPTAIAQRPLTAMIP